MTSQDYIRQTMLELIAISDEGRGSVNPADFIGDDLETGIRKAALDGAIMHQLNQEAINILKAFQMADVTVQQAAKVIYVAGLFSEMKGGK